MCPIVPPNGCVLAISLRQSIDNDVKHLRKIEGENMTCWGYLRVEVEESCRTELCGPIDVQLWHPSFQGLHTMWRMCSIARDHLQTYLRRTFVFGIWGSLPAASPGENTAMMYS